MGKRTHRAVAMDKPEDPHKRSDWLVNIWTAIKDLDRRLRRLEKLIEKDKSLL